MKNPRLMLFTALAGASMIGVLVRASQMAPPEADRPRVVELGEPLRVIGDPYPVFSGIAMDFESDEVVLVDENRAAVLTYASQIQATERVMEPRREIRGPDTLLDRVCSVTISPEFQEIFGVNQHIRALVDEYAGNGYTTIAPQITTEPRPISSSAMTKKAARPE